VHSLQPNSSTISAVILAGGAGRRMGGVDKGLVIFRGKPLVEHVIARIAHQAGKLLISANRSEHHYEKYGYPLVADTLPDFPGPLAGILAALEVIDTDLLLAVPCDTPVLPGDLVQRLRQALTDNNADIAIPFDGVRAQAAIMLLRRSLASDLHDYLLSGERKVQLWLKRHKTAHADFSDQPGAFANLNTLDELTHLEQHGGH
jgi:molybdopterin-guanine dinucleotide biosynthesis protein A